MMSYAALMRVMGKEFERIKDISQQMSFCAAPLSNCKGFLNKMLRLRYLDQLFYLVLSVFRTCIH